MNVLELVSQGLKGNNWSIEEKAYYIYIQSCLLFSYDSRYRFCGLIPNGEELQDEINNRKIDLENVQDNRVICTSHSREVFSQLLKQLLGIDSVVRGKSHAWVIFNDGCKEIEADTTASLDIARVKMGLNIHGYNYAGSYYNQLKEISKKVGYIQDEYTNHFLEERKIGLFEEFVNYSCSNEVFANSDDFLIYKLYTIKELFENFNQFQNFHDAEFCVSYLIYNFFERDIEKVETVSLFQNRDNDHWDFINLYPVQLENDVLYFMLEKNNDDFCFYEITSADAFHYVKALKGIDKKLIYGRR